MTMTPFFRKLGLTAHITFSIGWMGAVSVFLVLAIAGLTSESDLIVRSSYIAMELISWSVIVPLSVSALFTGIVQSIGTPWGLFRHYWVAAKIALTIVAIAVLFLHMNPIGEIATIASTSTLDTSDYRGLRIQLLADAGAALLVLLLITIISVYKPWGRIQLSSGGRIKKGKPTSRGNKVSGSRILYILVGLIILVLLTFIILHISGVMGNH